MSSILTSDFIVNAKLTSIFKELIHQVVKEKRSPYYRVIFRSDPKICG